MRPRLALWNGSGMDNIGDQAIDQITRRELALRLPGIDFVTFTPWPGRYCQNRLWINREGVWSGHGLFRSIVVGGGALLLGPPFRDPSGQFFLLGPNPALFQDTCPILWNGVCSDSQHRAPISAEWRNFVVNACERVSYRSVRNERTEEFLQACGVNGTIEVVPDICVIADKRERISRSAKRPTIAIVAGRPVFPTRFTSRIGEIAKANLSHADPELLEVRRYDEDASFSDDHYAQRLHQVFAPLANEADLVVAAFGEMYGDDLTCAALAEKLSVPFHRLWNLNLDGVLEFFAGVDVVVGFRLHACVLSLSAGTPFVAVDPYYDCNTQTSKLREFAGQCGFENSYFPLSEALGQGIEIRGAVRDALTMGQEKVFAVKSRLSSEVEHHFDVLAQKIPV